MTCMPTIFEHMVIFNQKKKTSCTLLLGIYRELLGIPLQAFHRTIFSVTPFPPKRVLNTYQLLRD